MNAQNMDLATILSLCIELLVFVSIMLIGGDR